MPTVIVEYDASAAIKKLGLLDKDMVKIVRVSTLASLFHMQERVVTTKLSGQYLNIVSGNLISSIPNSIAIVVENKKEISGVIGSDRPYGEWHEDGFKGDIEVPKHFVPSHKRRVGKVKKSVTIKGYEMPRHTRSVDFRARGFFKDTFDEEVQVPRLKLRLAFARRLTTGNIPSTQELL